MTALVKRSLPAASPGSIDRAMKAFGLNGIRRSKGIRTTIPGKDGRRAGDLLNRDFTACAPNRTWVMDFTYVRTWVGFVYVSFIVDVFAQRIVAWHAATCKDVELVMTPLRMAIWQRDRDGHPIERDQLIGHADAGSQYTSITFTEHLDLEGIRPSIGTVADAFDCETVGCRGPVQDRVHPHHRLPPRAVPQRRGRRVGHRRMGRLVQQPAPAQ